MTKKDLIKTSKYLFKKNEILVSEKEDLKNENQQLVKEIELLENKISDLQKEIDALKNSEPKISATIVSETPIEINNITLEPECEYGAKIIGQIVVDATTKCNSLTLDGDTGNRELVNLILGRTEVAKAEILKIVSSDISLEDKKNKIDLEKNETVDYFGSVMAQKN